MIEQTIYKHLLSCGELASYLTEYAEKPAIFFQKAPPDTDSLWQDGAQYGRIVFAIDAEGDPKVNGVTLTFSLLAFPLLTTENPAIARFNDWTAEIFPDLSVIGLDGLPEVWKPAGKSAGIYWRVASVAPAEWIPDTWQTIWRTATLQGHIFAQDVSAASVLAHEIIFALNRAKHLVKSGETQIIIRRTRVDNSADALHTGQVTVDATYAQIKHPPQVDTLRHIHFK